MSEAKIKTRAEDRLEIITETWKTIGKSNAKQDFLNIIGWGELSNLALFL